MSKMHMTQLQRAYLAGSYSVQRGTMPTPRDGETMEDLYEGHITYLQENPSDPGSYSFQKAFTSWLNADREKYPIDVIADLPKEHAFYAGFAAAERLHETRGNLQFSRLHFNSLVNNQLDHHCDEAICFTEMGRKAFREYCRQLLEGMSRHE